MLVELRQTHLHLSLPFNHHTPCTIRGEGKKGFQDKKAAGFFAVRDGFGRDHCSAPSTGACARVRQSSWLDRFA